MDIKLAERVCKTLERLINPHENWVEEFESVERQVNKALQSPSERKREHEDAERLRKQQ